MTGGIHVRGRRGTAGQIRGAAAAVLALLACVLVAVFAASSAGKPTPKPALEPVVFAGNNWDGTADVLRWTPPTRSKPGNFTRIARVNIVPDKDQRMQEILTNPQRLAYFLAIREAIGEGHDQFVDDMYSTNDGTHLIVSRPSFADVVSIDLATDQIAWRFKMDGQRSDHMGLSPDGKYVAVSDSTANVVHVLDTATGQEAWRFGSGDSPHENTYSRDGSRIYHASIGLVYTPADQPQFDSTKGDRRFEIVDTNTHQVIKTLNMGQKLAEAGYPNMSSAVRPMALSPDEQWVYFQVSFFHGFVEYNFAQDKVTRVANLPNLVPNMPREQYVLDSAHHGIAMNAAGTKLCVAGTMDDYAAIVSRTTFNYKLIQAGEKPYWSTDSSDGNYCFVSWSGTDSLSAISYDSEKEVARIQVGDHPQRVRNGVVRTDVPIAGI
ncbi:MAG: YncE family protein [Solirubrobacterales bacterium]